MRFGVRGAGLQGAWVWGTGGVQNGEHGAGYGDGGVGGARCVGGGEYDGEWEWERECDGAGYLQDECEWEDDGFFDDGGGVADGFGGAE